MTTSSCSSRERPKPGRWKTAPLGIIGISNKIRYKESLNERVKSSLSERDFVFPPYDANQLRAILSSRADAFRRASSTTT